MFAEELVVDQGVMLVGGLRFLSPTGHWGNDRRRDGVDVELPVRLAAVPPRYDRLQTLGQNFVVDPGDEQQAASAAGGDDVVGRARGGNLEIAGREFERA